MRALVFAYSQIGVEGIQTLLDLGVSVVGVVTHTDNPNEERWYDSVRDLAVQKQIPVITPDDANRPEVLSWGESRKPEIVFSFYYRKMLKKPWLEMPPRGAYNLHGSLLPQFRGRACVNWAIIEGAAETGVTLHEMLERPDAGAIIDQERVTILDTDTARSLFEKLVPAARRLLMRAVPLLQSGKATRTPQQESDATYFGARKPEDGRIDWMASAQRVHNLVRALTRPYPGAFTFLGGKKLFVWKGHVDLGAAEGRAGQVLKPTAEGVPVVTGDGVYIVEEVQFENGAIEPASHVLTARATILASEPVRE